MKRQDPHRDDGTGQSEKQEKRSRQNQLLSAREKALSSPNAANRERYKFVSRVIRTGLALRTSEQLPLLRGDLLGLVELGKEVNFVVWRALFAA